MSTAGAELVTPFDEGERALAFLARDVRLAAPEERLDTLRDAAIGLRPFVTEGFLSSAIVREKIFEVADLHSLSGEPGSEEEAAVGDIARLASALPDADEIERGIRLAAAETARRWEAADPRDNPALTAGDEPTSHTEIPAGADGERVPDDTEQSQASTKGQAAKTAPSIVPLVFESAASWGGIPLEPMRWLATRRIPAADVAILSGDGGQGKTTIALQLAVAVAAGLGDWLGTTCELGTVMFFSGEECRENIRHKLATVAAKRGVDPDHLVGLSFHFPEDPMLGALRRDGTIGPTPQMLAFEAAVLADRPALVIIDSVAGTFGGNYIDRVQVRTFVNMLAKVTKAADCAILLLDHPSMSGMQNGSGRGGSRDWQNAARAFMYLRPIDNEDGSKGRELEVMKINSGPIGEIQKLRFEDGCFVLQGASPAPIQAAAHSAAEQTYLACLDLLTAQGREVREHSGRGYAPSVFADMPEANGITARAFKAAQERLFSAGLIHNETVGPPSKRTKHIARKPEKPIDEAAQ
jgi:RecA-family ATPase